MRYAFDFEEDLPKTYSEWDSYEEEQEDSSWEFESGLGEFDEELADLEWEEEVRRRRRPPTHPRGSKAEPARPRRYDRRTARPAGFRPSRLQPPRLFPGPSVIFPPPAILPPPSRREDFPPQGGPAMGAPLEGTPPGSEGSEYVRWIQDSLNRIMSLQLPVDGIMGVGTRSAVRSFQKQHGLPETGFVGPDTERAITAALKPTQSELDAFEWEGEISRSSRDYIQWVQQSLNSILGLRLAVDGILGPMTRSAVRSFQSRYGLAVDGIVGPQTEGALIRAGATSPPGASTAPPSSPSPAPGVPTGGLDIVNVRGIQVARQIAPNLEAMLGAAAADGIVLGGGGFRTSDQQVALRKQNCCKPGICTSHYDIYEKSSKECSPQTARPGTSNHEKGLAIDFNYQGKTLVKNDPAFLWLSRNAARYGFYNLPSEPWHWSVDGK